MPDLSTDSLMSTGAALGFLPLALLQGARIRGRTLASVLPEGTTPETMGPLDAPLLRLLVIGDGAAVGAGCTNADDGLAARLAWGLSVRLRKRVQCTVRGEAGLTAAGLDKLLRRDGVPEADLAVILIGFNDVVSLTPRAAFTRHLSRTVDRLTEAGVRIVACSGVTSPEVLPGFPWPLAPLLGVRARQLDRTLRSFALGTHRGPERTLLHLPPPPVTAPAEQLATDGLHPSRSGYVLWGDALAATLALEFDMLPERRMAC